MPFCVLKCISIKFSAKARKRGEMKFQEFTKEVTKKMEERMGEAYTVEIQQVRKNNDVLLNGITIRAPKSNVVPTIYLEAFYELYENGTEMDEVVEKIHEVYLESIPKTNIDMDFFRDYEKVKDRIVYRLINAEKNTELLKEIPHIPFWDLAICFCYAFWSQELGDGMILIHNNHMEEWGVDHKQLMAMAEINTPKIYPVSFYGIHEVLKQLHVQIDLSECEEEQLFVLTNRQRTFGASVILYPNTLSWVAEQMQGDFYILPSSVHEVLILKKEKFQELQKQGMILHEMIREINTDQVATEEVLSDYPYFYDASEQRLIQN